MDNVIILNIKKHKLLWDIQFCLDTMNHKKAYFKSQA